MSHYARTGLPLLVCIFLSIGARSQLLIGGGFGSFHVPGATQPFRVYGPHLRLEYIQDDERSVPYLDVSYFSKSFPEGTTSVYDSNGIPVANADVTTKHSFFYTQLGARHLFSDADEKTVIPFVGAGIALAYIRETTSFKSTVDVPSQTLGRFDYGFHFSAGIQYNVGAVWLGLQGNLDIMIKPLTDDVSNIGTNLLLSATFPITKS